MQKIKTEIKWALIFTLMLLIWMVLEKITGLHDVHIEQHAIYTNVIMIPAIAVYVFALLDKRKKDYSGKMTYKQGFISGAIITLIVTLLGPLVQLMISYIISPDYFTNAIEYTVGAGLMDQMSAEEYFNLSSYIIQGLIGTPIMGIVTTAIVAIFVRTK